MTFKRVNKPTARKMYNLGEEIYLLPCKVPMRTYPDSSFIQPVKISKATSTTNANHFDRTVNEFEYYNCNAELGYYAHYYVEEKS